MCKRLLGISLLMALMLVISGISCSEDPSGADAEGSGCPYDFQCPLGTICINGDCVAGVCPYDFACPEDMDCVGGECVQPTNDCSFICPEGSICLEGRCVAIHSNCPGGCPDGTKCLNGRCVIIPSDCPGGCEDGQECIDNVCETISDACDPACSVGWVCIDNQCVELPGEGCDPECLAGWACVDNVCVEIPDNPVGTDGDSVCVINCGDEDDDNTIIPTDGDAPPLPDGDDTDAETIEYVEIEWDPNDFDYTQTPCDNNESLTIPAITVEPPQADFGAVPVGSTKHIELRVCNSGGADLHITGVQFSLDTSWEFYKFHDRLAITVEPGYATPIYLVYAPVNNEADSGDLTVLSDDPNNSAVHIPLNSSIKPMPLIRTNPRVMQFHGAAAGGVTTKMLEVTNVGTAGTTVRSLDILGGGASLYAVVEVSKMGEAPTPAPWTLQPENFLNAVVALDVPPSGPETVEDDTLEVVWISEVGTQRTPVTLTTGGSALCAVPIAEPDQHVRPLDTVHLDGSLSYDENGIIEFYMWEWVTKPDMTYRAIIKDANETNIQGVWSTESHPHFYAELAGTYQVRLSVKDEDEDCNPPPNQDIVTIVAVPDETIHVQLLWSQSSNDQDLHLIKPGGQHFRNCGGGVESDCHWCNCDTDHGQDPWCPPRGCPGPSDAPDWNQIGVREDDPTLDIDDISGRGPENINLSLPELGDYLVTVERYSGSSTTLQVTVRVWLFGVLFATYRYGPPDTATVIPQTSHWNVCWLRVHDPTFIEVIPIGTTTPSSRSRGEELTVDKEAWFREHRGY